MTTTAQHYGTPGSAVANQTVGQFLATTSGGDFLKSIQAYAVGEGFYVSQPNDNVTTIATNVTTALSGSMRATPIDPATLERLNAAIGNTAINSDGTVAAGSTVSVPATLNPLGLSSTGNPLPLIGSHEASSSIASIAASTS